jgi:predicted acyl esterase
LGGHRLRKGKHGTPGSDTIAWASAGSPCGRAVDQWAMGGISIPAHMSGFMAPCADDDSSGQANPDVLHFTTRPFNKARMISGPMNARIYATSTTSETQWVAEVEIVTPSGASYPLSEGALLGSLRKVDRRRSWRSHGRMILPYHRYTRASQHAVRPGKPTRYDIEIFPTLVTVPKGDRIRLTLSTSDTPHLTPLPAQLAKLTGGVYQVAHGGTHGSALILDVSRP